MIIVSQDSENLVNLDTCFAIRLVRRASQNGDDLWLVIAEGNGDDASIKLGEFKAESSALVAMRNIAFDLEAGEAVTKVEDDYED